MGLRGSILYAARTPQIPASRPPWRTARAKSHSIANTFSTVDKGMVPVLPIYVAVLVVLSVLFAPNVVKTLPGVGESLAALSGALGDVLGVVGAGMNSAEMVTEKAAEGLVDKVGSAAGELAKKLFVEEPPLEVVAETSHVPEWAIPYMEIVGKWVCGAFCVANHWATIVYNVLAEHIHVALQWPPLAQMVNEYAKLHAAYVSPAVFYAVEKYSCYVEPAVVGLAGFFEPALDDLRETWDSLSTGDSTLPGPILYGVVILMLFVFINLVTKLSKVFLKDIFWVNQGVSSMYGPTSTGLFAAVGGERGDSYDEMKPTGELVRDEIEELEKVLAAGESARQANSRDPVAKPRGKKPKKNASRK